MDMSFCGIFSRLSVICKKVRVLVRLHENDFGTKQSPWTLHVLCEDPLLTRTEKISKQGVACCHSCGSIGKSYGHQSCWGPWLATRDIHQELAVLLIISFCFWNSFLYSYQPISTYRISCPKNLTLMLCQRSHMLHKKKKKGTSVFYTDVQMSIHQLLRSRHP